MIAACQVSHTAKEIPKGADVRRGALAKTTIESLGMLQAEKRLPSCQTLFQDINAKIVGVVQQQNPMIYGERNRVFLGSGTVEDSRYTTVVDVTKSKVFIGMGSLHGVSKGDTYHVYPPGTANLNGAKEIVTITIDRVFGAKSSAPLPKDANVERGCPVTLVKANSTAILRVSVHSNDLPEELRKQITKGTSFIAADEADATHEIRLSDTGKDYIITDRNGARLRNSPSFSQASLDIAEMREFLEKVAHCTRVKNYSNGLELADAFKFEEIGNKTVVKENDTITLRVTNLQKSSIANPNTLYFSIFNLRPDWEVVLVAPFSGESYWSIEVSAGSFNDDTEIEMTIPNEKDTELEDTFLVIITTQPANFEILATINSQDKSSRSVNLPDRLEYLPLPDSDGRDGQVVPRPDCGKWHTAQFVIKTEREIGE